MKESAWREGAFKFKPGDNTKVIYGQCELQGIFHEQVKGESVSSLLTHLKVKHPIFWMKIKGLSDCKQQKVSTYFYGTGDWK